MTQSVPQQMSNALLEVEPHVTSYILDTRKQVKVTTTATMKVACDVTAVTKPEENQEISWEKLIATKRQSDVISNNMSKFVDSPLNAAPLFLSSSTTCPWIKRQ